MGQSQGGRPALGHLVSGRSTSETVPQRPVDRLPRDAGFEPGALDRVVSSIVECCKPLKIILFGSRARRTHRRDSDFDIAVVVPDSANQRESMRRARRATKGHPIPARPMVMTISELHLRAKDTGCVYRYILRDGETLFNDHDEKEHPVPRPLDNPASPVELMELAEINLHAIVALMQNGVSPSIVCFNTQQAVEKILKAIIAFNGTEYPFKHDLAKLAELVPASWRIHDFGIGYEKFEGWAVSTRYSLVDAPTTAEAELATKTVNAAWDATAEDFRERGLRIARKLPSREAHPQGHPSRGK